MPPNSWIVSDCASQTRTAYRPPSWAMTNPVTVSLKRMADGSASSLPRTVTVPSTSTPSTWMPSAAVAVRLTPDSPSGSGAQRSGNAPHRLRRVDHLGGGEREAALRLHDRQLATRVEVGELLLGGLRNGGCGCLGHGFHPGRCHEMQRPPTLVYSSRDRPAAPLPEMRRELGCGDARFGSVRYAWPLSHSVVVSRLLPHALPTPTSSVVIEQPEIPGALDAPEIPPYYEGAQTLAYLTSRDGALSIGPYEDLGGGLLAAVDCAGSGTLTVHFGESGSVHLPCESTIDQPVLHYNEEYVMAIGVFQFDVEITGDVVWGLTLATFPPARDLAFPTATAASFHRRDERASPRPLGSRSWRAPGVPTSPLTSGSERLPTLRYPRPGVGGGAATAVPT